MAATTTRQTADQRRDTVLDAAMIEFGLKGLHGASTDDIARRAGISQPYLFRLFRTKRELFLASVERCFRRTEQTFRDAVTGDTPEQRLQSMGMAYCELLADRPKLMMQMQAYAACDDPAIRTVVRNGYRELVDYVERVSGLPPERVSHFFAKGMLLNVIASMDLLGADEGWAQRLIEGCRQDV
jgi:AcrR family transcriptional regulator